MLEAEIKELTAAVKENTELLRQMNAGREEALKALTEGGAATTTAPTRRRSAAAKAAEAAADPAVSAADAKKDDAAAAAASWNPDISVDGMRTLMQDYLSIDDADAKTARTAQLRSVLDHFGVDAVNPIPSKPDKKSLEGDDVRRQAAFFLTRIVNGLPVDFKADWNFDSDPLAQGDLEPAAEPAAAEEDLLG